MTKPAASSVGQNVSQQSAPVQSLAPCSRAAPEETCLGGRFWRERAWEVTGDLADSDSPGVNIEITSVDSDTASASSVTSGYESAAPASDRCWENLVKKYDGVLQHCLQNNRAHAKVSGERVQSHGSNAKHTGSHLGLLALQKHHLERNNLAEVLLGNIAITEPSRTKVKHPVG